MDDRFKVLIFGDKNKMEGHWMTNCKTWGSLQPVSDNLGYDRAPAVTYQLSAIIPPKKCF